MDKKPTVRIAIVDEQKAYRIGVRTILDAVPEFSVVADVEHAGALFALVQTARPDVVIVNSATANGDTVGFISALRTALPLVKVVYTLEGFSCRLMVDVLFRGAHGLISRTADPEFLVHAVHAAVRDELFVFINGPASVDREDFSDFDALVPPENGSRLSRREKEVLSLVLAGATSREIAAQLFISPRTVENHRSNITRKLGMRNQVELLRYAAQFGLVEL